MHAAGTTLRRIPALDGIRGVAIGLVLWWHTTSTSLSGHHPYHSFVARILKLSRFTWSGVDLFFVLSGFLIGGILLDAEKSSSYFSTFYIRRAYRIIPLYAVVILANFVVNRHYGTGRMGSLAYATEFLYYLCFVQNVRMAATGSFGPIGLDVTWSLAVEEQFYLTLPLIVRHISRRLLWRVLLAAVVIAPLLRILAVRFMNMDWIAAYVLMPCRADALCLGVLIAMATRNALVWGQILAHRKYVFSAFALASCAGLWMLLGGFQPFTMQMFGLEYSLLAVLYSLVLVSTLVSPWLSSLFSFTPLRFMGVVAYGVYLFHPLVASVFRQGLLHFYPARSNVVSFLTSVCAAVASVALAAISWEYFEKSLVKRGHRHQY